ncbi:MAG: putative delta-60 repeat protein [Arenicella sp.]|jgi:uncharacterized delta-60 repeat protein
MIKGFIVQEDKKTLLAGELSDMNEFLMIKDFVVQEDKKNLIAGELSDMSMKSIHGILRLDAYGDIDPQFNPPHFGFNDTVTAMIQDDNGRIIIAGTYTSPTSSTQNYIVGLNEDGSSGDWFKPAFPNGSILTMLRQRDGRLLAGGRLNDLKGSKQNGLTRLTSDNEYDDTFTTQFNSLSWVLALNQQQDGKILVGGNFINELEPDTRQNLTRLNADGSTDPSFVQKLDGWVFCVLEEANGQILIGGYFKHIDNRDHKYMARLNADGSLDESFKPDLGELGWVYSFDQQSDGRIVIGGEFTSVDGIERNYVARLNMDGSLDEYFDPGAGTDASVKIVKIEDNGKIILGGEFNHYNNQPRKYIAKVNEDGSLDLGFGDSLNSRA